MYVVKDVPNGIDPSPQATYGVGLLGHEITHSMQFVRLGVHDFYSTYLTDWATNGKGYDGIKLEREVFRIGDKIQNDLQKNGLNCNECML